MKGTGLLALALSVSIFVAPTALWADLTIHQVDKWSMEGEGKETTERVTLYIKGKMIRLEQAPGRAVIIRYTDKKMIELEPEEKSYTEVSLEALKKMAELASGLIKGLEEITGRKPEAKEPSGQALRVIRTGERRTISGFPCELYRVEGKEFSGEFWVTQATDAGRELYPIQKEMAEFTKEIAPAVDRDVVGELERIGGTVIQSMMRFQGPAGKMTMESRVERILRSPLSEGLFYPPADFRRKADVKDPKDSPEKALEELIKGLGRQKKE